MSPKSPKTTSPGGPIAPNELKELRRVYDQAGTMQRLQSIKCTLAEYSRPLTSSMRQRDFFLSSSGHHRQSILGGEEDRETKMAALQQEQAELEKKLSEIRSRNAQYIRPQDTAAALKSLGKRVSKREVQNMMWEVDEKLDGVIDWDEFQLNFERNIRDSSGLEPASFYHMVQFMIYDRDNNGLVSIDETMNMLYARVGRTEMESVITKLFGGDDGAIKEDGRQGGEIDFQKYSSVVVREQQKISSPQK